MNKTRQDGNVPIPWRPRLPLAVLGNIPKCAPRRGATFAIIHNDEFVVAKSRGGRVGCNCAITLRLAPKTEVPGRVVWRIGKNAGIKFGTPVHHRLVARYGFPPADEFDRNDPRDRFGLPISG